jgi:hypothetical protein
LVTRYSEGFTTGLMTGVVLAVAIVMMISPSLRQRTVDGVGDVMRGMGDRMGRAWSRSRNAAEDLVQEQLS